MIEEKKSPIRPRIQVQNNGPVEMGDGLRTDGESPKVVVGKKGTGPGRAGVRPGGVVHDRSPSRETGRAAMSILRELAGTEKQ